MNRQEKLVAMLRQGGHVWNEWRRGHIPPPLDLAGTDLRGADLRDVDLSGLNLRNANLAGASLVNANLAGAALSLARLRGADLTGASLVGANLSSATLADTDCSHADLTAADLTLADFRNAKLQNSTLLKSCFVSTELSGADLSGAHLGSTVFVDTNLSAVLGLEGCIHIEGSTLDNWTLTISGTLPYSFLRSCGLPDRPIEYLPSLVDGNPIQFYSCFISYSSVDQDFANRLHADLQARGVRCWFAPHDMLPGQKIYEQIERAIRVYERLLLILSPASMQSSWVKTEIAKARQKERSQNRQILFPIALVPFEKLRTWEQFDSDRGDDSAKEIREFHIPDFRGWENPATYRPRFEQLVRALRSPDDVSGP